MLCPHPRHSRAAAIGQLRDRDSKFLLIRGVILNVGTHLCVVDNDGEARRVAPPVELNTLYCLPFHGLKTGFRLCFRGFPVPPFQMPEGLMNFPLGKFGDNRFADLRRTRCAVPLQRCMYTLHTPAFQPTKLARPAERRALLYQQPRAIAHPVAPVGLRRLRLHAGDFQCLEGPCQVVLLPGGSCSGNS
jgi:hypothetical protein